MSGFLGSLSSGDWLTRERLRLVAVAVLLCSLASLVALVATSKGSVDWRGHPIGTDFANVYAAGTFVLQGQSDAPFDPARHHARQQAIFGETAPFYGWHYPPFFLFPAAALALLPYQLALAVWLSTTFLLYLLAIRTILRSWGRPDDADAPVGVDRTIDRSWLLFAAAFPAVLVNAGHGQNGFLSAALIGGALVLLDRRPIAAGVLFGLLSYKPQFGVMIPLVLAATHRWRTFTAAVVTVCVLVLISTWAFGVQVWSAFFTSTEFSRSVVLEAGDTGWQKIQSVFSWVRMWGGSVGLAYALHAACVSALAIMVVWLWRSDQPYPLKAGVLVIASILSTPYALDYDMMMLAPAIAFLVVDGYQRGFGPGQKTVLALLWLVPLVARSVPAATLMPVGVWLMATALFISLRPRQHDNGAAAVVLRSTTISRSA